MNCKHKKKCAGTIGSYYDGDYVVCLNCGVEETCPRREKCAICGEKRGIFYSRKLDVFLCTKCEYEVRP